MKSQITLVIVSRSKLIRHGIALAIEKCGGIQCVGFAEHPLDVLGMMCKAPPDIVLVYADMMDWNILAAIKHIKQTKPNQAMLLLSSFAYEAYVFSAFEANVDGYLLSTVTTEELVAAIRRVMNGERAFSSEIINLRQRIDSRLKEEPRLKKRQSEVLILAAYGMGNEQIATLLNISQNTVARHLSAVFQTTGIKSRSELILYALKHGLLLLDRGTL